MPRPVKWSRDVHSIRDRAQRSKTETWSRQDVERLFGISRPSAQNLMKAIGGVQAVGAAHFVDRTSLLHFLDQVLAGETVESAVRSRLLAADPTPTNKPLRVSLPAGLRAVLVRDLPSCIALAPGKLTIEACTPAEMVESLALLAQAMQNDLLNFERAVERLRLVEEIDDELQDLFRRLRDID